MRKGAALGREVSELRTRSVVHRSGYLGLALFLDLFLKQAVTLCRFVCTRHRNSL
jgi:hypothetical protein